MKRITHHSLIVAGASFASVACSGVGEMETSIASQNDARPPSLTYTDLVEQDATSVQVMDMDVDATVQEPKAIEVQADAKIIAAATCHPGELDLAETLVDNDGMEPLKLTLTIETDDHRLLASTALDHEKLVTSVRQLYGGQTASFLETLTLRLPGDIVKTHDFDANMFVCVDSDRDGSCIDEQVDEIGSLEQYLDGNDDNDRTPKSGTVKRGEGASFVLGYVPLAGLVENADDIAFVRRSVGSDDENGPPAAKMSEMMKNYDAEAFGIPNEPMQITLAGLTAPGCTYSVRTSGCFVEGTQITVAKDKTVAVEKLPRGSMVLTSSGRPRVARRAVSGPESDPVLTLRTDAGHALTVTRMHPIMTADGLKLARDLEQTDKLVDAKGGTVSLVSITAAPYSGLVYNFELPGESLKDHLVVADGLVVGDLFLQEKLSAGRWLRVAASE